MGPAARILWQKAWSERILLAGDDGVSYYFVRAEQMKVSEALGEAHEARNRAIRLFFERWWRSCGHLAKSIVEV